MKIEIVLAVLSAGVVGSFLVASAGRVVTGEAWPQAAGATRFSVLPLILALLAGPALFIEAVVREGRLGRLQPAGWALCAIIATGWAACYGVLVLQCAAWAGLILPGSFA